MKIAVYSLTRDRLKYTQHCFKKMRELAGHPFDHYVWDNGSTDGTPEWLKQNEINFKKVTYSPINIGIAGAANKLLDQIYQEDYDLIVKIDNDCEFLHENTFKDLARLYTKKYEEMPHSQHWVLSPKVVGINAQLARSREFYFDKYKISETGHIGGLFYCTPAKLLQNYRYPTIMPLGYGDDSEASKYLKSKGCLVGYIESMTVGHYMGTDQQALDYPEYHKRKLEENPILKKP